MHMVMSIRKAIQERVKFANMSSVINWKVLLLLGDEHQMYVEYDASHTIISVLTSANFLLNFI